MQRGWAWLLFPGPGLCFHPSVLRLTCWLLMWEWCKGREVSNGLQGYRRTFAPGFFSHDRQQLESLVLMMFKSSNSMFGQSFQCTWTLFASLIKKKKKFCRVCTKLSPRYVDLLVSYCQSETIRVTCIWCMKPRATSFQPALHSTQTWLMDCGLDWQGREEGATQRAWPVIPFWTLSHRWFFF